MSTDADLDAYTKIVEALDWDRPSEFVDRLRMLADRGQIESMNLLAVLLGDIDPVGAKREILELYKRAAANGSLVAAENLAIQQRQWENPKSPDDERRTSNY